MTYADLAYLISEMSENQRGQEVTIGVDSLEDGWVILKVTRDPSLHISQMDGDHPIMNAVM